MALNYLNTKNIAHRDLEPNKILFKPFEGDLTHDKLQIKIIDFELATKTSSNDAQGFVGEPFYIAPEIYKKESYGSPCDIWSLGVISYLLLTGELPFNG